MSTSTYCYNGSAENVCELNVRPYCIDLSCVPEGEPTKPNDIVLGAFIFAKWDGTPDDYWWATSHGTSGDDVISGNALLASIEAASNGSVAQAANGTYLGDEVYFHIDGGEGNDTITGGANYDRLYGSNGNDQVNGLGGSDEVYGGAGDDMVKGGDGDDWVDGGEGNDTASGGAGNDNVAGGTGADTVNGSDGNDNLFGDTNGMDCDWDDRGDYHAPETSGDGADTMDGGLGNDMMFGQGGDEDMMGGLGDDGMDGGSGNDSMSGGDGIDNMTGGSGDDTMAGDAGNDIMNAGDGNDLVDGGIGNDWIGGGLGDDELTGGAGKDHFVFCDDCGCDGDDYISDFTTTRQRDQIDLTELKKLDLVISSETGDHRSAFLELISYGEDGECGTDDDYSIGTIYIDSLQKIGRVFDLDSTFGTTSNSLVRVSSGVKIDLPSDSFVYNGEFII